VNQRLFFALAPAGENDQNGSMQSIPALLLLSISIVYVGAAVDWPEFRGPRLATEWSETKNIKWKTAVPHKGISSPVVMDNQVWLTTATEDGHDFYVLKFAADTGKILLNEKLFHSEQPESLGNGASMNSYATPSMTAEPGRVYVHFGSFGTAALDAETGKVLWKREDLRCRHYRGASSSPVLFEDLIILTFDGADLQYHAALDKKTGETRWKTDRSVAWNDENVPGQMAKDGDLRKAHSTPLIAESGGKPLLISSGAKAAYGYDPRTGKELWRVQYNDWSVAPRPIFDTGMAFIVTGLVRKELWAVKASGSGDVTETHVAWKQKAGIGKYSSPILVDGLIYTAAEESFISCIDARNGEVVWTERVGGKFAASPVYADGHLYFFDQQGKALVVKPHRTLNIIATNTLDSGLMASPAVAGKALFVRTKTHLYRVEN
jgi:outer membrane protein assembly factor BamB